MAYTDKEIIAALKATKGKVYLAADALECSPVTIYSHMKKNPEIQQLVDDFRQKIVDKAERALEDAVEEGEHWAVGLALKTIGKNRGYVERQEVVASGDLKLYGKEAPTDDV